MIVGTAGHIDHGKTTLVRALTGVDTDRLPEEKQRGISIELGYAFLDLPGPPPCRVGFIDVPGHERLVHTMLAGATGIQFALLLVAADDGVMPQTREHLAVLSLLGLDRAAVVLTKIDRVPAERVAEVSAQAAALLRGTPLSGAPVLPVAALRGEGLPALRALLQSAALAQAGRTNPAQCFRLAVDRSFSLGGVGTVVTGTIHSGEVAVGDELALVPGLQTMRVRSLHAQNQPVSRAQAGQRCALALAGVDKSQLRRGQWLVDPRIALSADRLDAELQVWPDETKPLRSGTSVHLHLGAADVMATVAVLDATELAPGAAGRVQLVLREPVGAWQGDRVVLRDASASRTLAGGRVLDPFGPVRYRRTPQRLAELQALGTADPAERLRALLTVAPQGVDLNRWAAAQAVPLADLPKALPDALPDDSPEVQPNDSPEVLPDALAEALTDPQAGWALGPRQAAAAGDAALQALAAFHQRHPDELGPDVARLRRLALPRLAEPLWLSLLTRLLERGKIARRGAVVHLPSHGVHLSATETRVAQKVAPRLAQAGFEGAWVRDLARDCAESEPQMRVVLARLAQRGELHQVVKDLYYPSQTMTELASRVRRLAQAQSGEVAAAGFRDATGLGRKRAIQILEYFDRIGLLRRLGDVHKLRPDSRLYIEESP